MIIIKKLESAELIEDACALLYKVYQEEVSWDFSPDNPSQLKVEVRNNRKVLVDRFTDQAIWFGAFDESQIVGCARLTRVDQNNKLEMEGYNGSAVIQRYLPQDKSHCAELTRAAVLKSHGGRGIIRHLFLAIFQYCEDHQYSVCATPNFSYNGYIVKLLKEIGWPLKMEIAFKYEEQDPGPVNFNFADYAKSEVKNVILNLASYQVGINPNNAKILDALEIVAPILPTPVYWHDTKGIVLGMNAHCLKAIGATRDIIGKTPYEFYPKEVAEHVLKHNEQVIKTGEILSQDEPMKNIATGETKVFRSIKAPLYDDKGKIIGIIGSSIEVTAEKEAERLRIENEKQKTLLEQEGKFTKLANQVAHDIRSPLASLVTIVKESTQLPEANRIALREAAIGISDIANHLLHQYQKKDAAEMAEFEERQAVLVSTVLLETLSAKKYQYENLPVKFDYHFEPNTHFAFIKTQASSFKRMLSNVINNAVDALEEESGKVDLHLKADNEWVKIIIQDTGKGMSSELLDKIMRKTAVTEGKKSGHGIGLTQVWETLEHNQGEMQIASEPGKGTTLTLIFPRATAPHWIAETITLRPNDIIVILDDDTSIHGAWDLRFDSILGADASIQLKHFHQGKEALEFIAALAPTEKESVFLLSDYELLTQELNGLEIIAESEVERSMLVTSHYAHILIQEKAVKIGTQILPKQLASEILIRITEIDEEDAEKGVTEKVDAVIIDDDKTFINMLVLHVFADQDTEEYHKPEDFLKNLDKYAKDTKIFLDNNYATSDLKGLDIAKELHERGYQQLYLLSGEVFGIGDVPSYLTVIEKTDTEHLKKVVNGPV